MTSQGGKRWTDGHLFAPSSDPMTGACAGQTCCGRTGRHAQPAHCCSWILGWRLYVIAGKRDCKCVAKIHCHRVITATSVLNTHGTLLLLLRPLFAQIIQEAIKRHGVEGCKKRFVAQVNLCYCWSAIHHANLPLKFV